MRVICCRLFFKGEVATSTAMKIIGIGRLKIEDLEAVGKIPKGLQWSKPVPQGYSINLIKNDKATRTIIVCTDILGACVSYAVFDGNIDLSGTENVLHSNEVSFIKSRYPELLEEIDALN